MTTQHHFTPHQAARRTELALFAALLTATPLTGTVQAAAVQTATAQVKTVQPASALPTIQPGLGGLSFFIGIWQEQGAFHATPFSTYKPIEMTVTVTAEEHGFWLLSRTLECATAANPTPLTARYLWGRDTKTNGFTADWFDSNGGHAVQRSPGWTGDTLVFLGTMTLANGMAAPLRDTFTRTGTNTYHHLGEANLGSGWIAVDEEDAVRSGAAQ